MSTLSPAQLAFLRFANDAPKPLAWEWLKADGSHSLAAATHAFIEAVKRRGGEAVRCRLARAELEGLQPYWLQPLYTLNPDGLALIQEGP